MGALTFILSSYAANFGLGLVIHTISGLLTRGAVEKELQDPKGPFRSMEDSRMLYPPFISGLVNASLLLWCKSFLGLNVAGMEYRYAFALWVMGAGHGVLMDYSCYKISAKTAAHFWVSTLATALMNGYLLSKWA